MAAPALMRFPLVVTATPGVFKGITSLVERMCRFRSAIRIPQSAIEDARIARGRNGRPRPAAAARGAHDHRRAPEPAEAPPAVGIAVERGRGRLPDRGAAPPREVDSDRPVLGERGA